MPDKDEIRIRKATNLYDLLDDGVANNSDILELVELEDKDATQPPATTAQRMATRPELPASKFAERKVHSWPGILLGMLVFIAGTATTIHPTAMNVWHDRAKYGTRSFFEHVNPDRARFYGICVAIVGLVILAYSLIKMPAANEKS